MNLREFEAFGIPDSFRMEFMVGTKTATLRMMPGAVLAFAYLVSVKRKKEKATLKLEETSEVQVELTGENNEPADDISEVQEDISAEAKE